MKSILLLLSLCVACSHLGRKSLPDPVPSPDPDQIQIPDQIQTLPEIEVVERSPVFSTTSSLQGIQDAVRVSNCIIRSQEFLREIGAFPQYDFTRMSSGDVMLRFKNSHQINVGTYRTKNPVSRVYATTYMNDKHNFWINTRKLPRPLPDLINTIFHESSHLLEFGHGDNSPVGKQNSVPWRVGSIAEKHVLGCSSK
jgi:hypothetical protein